MTVEARIDTNPNIQRQLPSKANSLAHISEQPQRKQYPSYAERTKQMAHQGCQTPAKNGNGFYEKVGDCWAVRAQEVTDVRSYEMKQTNLDGTVQEVTVTNYSF